jgi:ssDNA-binding Zn-finger/Zn-ribbon topoisomerase 1
MVLKSEVMNSESLSKKKSKQVICPTCGGPAQIKIKNYKISIYECENQHKKDDLNLDEFVNSQFINEKNIICDGCKYNTKEDSYNNKFFFVIIAN